MDSEQKLKETVFFVEANSNETHMLWKENHDSVDWVQDNLGFSQVIGFIKDDKEMPVNVSFTFNIIDGHRVCFYDVVSRFSDSVMVEDWIEKNYPIKWDNGTRKAMTNAMNFHHAIHCIQNLNK